MRPKKGRTAREAPMDLLAINSSAIGNVSVGRFAGSWIVLWAATRGSAGLTAGLQPRRYDLVRFTH
jgi:hypothetical protein